MTESTDAFQGIVWGTVSIIEFRSLSRSRPRVPWPLGRRAPMRRMIGHHHHWPPDARHFYLSLPHIIAQASYYRSDSSIIAYTSAGIDYQFCHFLSAVESRLAFHRALPLPEVSPEDRRRL